MNYLHDLSERLAAHGMSLMVDVVLDHLAADAPLVATHPGLFRPARHDASGPIDPRRPMERTDIAATRCEDAAAVASLADIFAPILAGWARAGVAGFRALAPRQVPPALWQAVLGRVREVRPDLITLAWTPGLSPADVASLSACGFTRSVGSAPWWDGRAPWLAREYEDRRMALPSIGLVEDPAGPRIAASLAGPDKAARRVALERALALAAVSGAGLLMPMGFEHGALRPLDMTSDRPADWSWRDGDADVRLADAIAAAIALMRDCAPLGMAGQMMPLSGPGAPVATFARALGGDLRRTQAVALVFANASLHAPASVLPDAALAALDGRFPILQEVFPGNDHEALAPGQPVLLAPGEVRVYAGRAVAPRAVAMHPLKAEVARALPRIAIERVAPAVDDGRFPVKRLAGEAVAFSADILGDGHEILAAALRWQAPGEEAWREAPMARGENDRWSGHVPLLAPGIHQIVVEAWRNLFATWRDEVEKKHAAAVPITLELREGITLVEQAAARAKGADAKRFAVLLARLGPASEGDRLHDLLSEETRLLMERWAERTQAVRTTQRYPVMADRRAAAFASWYEMFPRSASDDASRHGTFDDVIAAPAARPRHGLRRALLHADPSDRPHQPQGPQQHADAGPGRSRQPLCDRRRRGRARRAAPGARHARRLPPARRGGRRRTASRSRSTSPSSARPDHPWLKQHPGVVRLAAGRHDQVRREPAEEVRGHRQRRLLRAGCRARRCGSRCATSSCSGSSRACASSASTTRTPSRCRSGNG